MFRSLTLAASWLVALACVTTAVPGNDAVEETSEPDSMAGRRELVRQLGHPSYIVRQLATEKLAAEGPAAKDALTKAVADPDPEIRRRARLLLGRLSEAAEHEAADDRPPTLEPTAQQPALVRQLGAPSLFAREQAARRLAAMGSAGKAVLTEAQRDTDLEIRLRARAILEGLLRDEFEARLAAFLAGDDSQARPNLSGWNRFMDLVGGERDAREMFAKMIRSESTLLSAFEERSPELPKMVADRATWLQSRTSGGGSDVPNVSPEALALLLLIGCDQTL